MRTRREREGRKCDRRTSRRGLAALHAKLAKLSDDELLAEVRKAHSEAAQQSGAEVVRLKDALLGAGKQRDERLALLRERREAINSEAAAVDEVIAVVAKDDRTLRIELARLEEEVRARFGGDWNAASSDTRRPQT